MTTNVAVVLFPDVEELDFAGPYEVFGMFSKWIDKDWSVFTVAEHKQVRGNIGLNVTADYTFDDAPNADVLLVPGGLGTREGADNQALVGYIRRAGAGAQYVTSVCTGAFLLHRAGFLEGKKATTHWGSRDRLQQEPGVTVVAERWVHDGNVVTAAGVSAGIDMALYVLGVMAGPEAARRTQHFIEYDPAPPYAEVPLPA